MKTRKPHLAGINQLLQDTDEERVSGGGAQIVALAWNPRGTLLRAGRILTGDLRPSTLPRG